MIVFIKKNSFFSFFFFFFFQFCDVAQVVTVHIYHLAKFGDIENMKVSNLKHPIMFEAIVATFGDFF
jgi:hypothetical protein